MLDAKKLEVGSWIWDPSACTSYPRVGGAYCVCRIDSRQRVWVKTLLSNWGFGYKDVLLTEEMLHALVAPIADVGKLPEGTPVLINGKVFGTVAEVQRDFVILSCESYVPVFRTARPRSPLRDLLFFADVA